MSTAQAGTIAHGTERIITPARLHGVSTCDGTHGTAGALGSATTPVHSHSAWVSAGGTAVGGGLPAFITAGIMVTAPGLTPGTVLATVPDTDRATFTKKRITGTATPKLEGRRIDSDQKQLPTGRTTFSSTKAAMPTGAPATAGRNARITAGKKATCPAIAADRLPNPRATEASPIWNVTTTPSSGAAIAHKTINARDRPDPEGAVALGGAGKVLSSLDMIAITRLMFTCAEVSRVLTISPSGVSKAVGKGQAVMTEEKLTKTYLEFEYNRFFLNYAKRQYVTEIPFS
ncbi:MAG: hypothetical protein ISS66_07925 [Desulfobacteraceae bacterium]|nr:hypothetical protein [Desulfobacteraceae bacterium]